MPERAEMKFYGEVSNFSNNWNDLRVIVEQEKLQMVCNTKDNVQKEYHAFSIPQPSKKCHLNVFLSLLLGT